jgi:hypothetical protein
MASSVQAPSQVVPVSKQVRSDYHRKIKDLRYVIRMKTQRNLIIPERHETSLTA